MGTINWDNIAAYAQDILQRANPDLLDPNTLEALEDGAAGIVAPSAAAHGARRLTADEYLDKMIEQVTAGAAEVQGQAPTGTKQVPGQVPAGTRQVHGQVHRQVPTGTEQVPQFESAATSSDLLIGSEKKCAALNKRTGNPCKARPSSSGYCVFHDPDLTEAVNEIRARGGRSPRRALVAEARKLDFQVMDHGGIQALIAHVLRLQLLGAFTPRQASHAVQLVGHLVSNAREMSPSEEAFKTFEATTRDLTEITDVVAARMETRDLNDRVNAIQDVGSRREQLLKANERFAPRPTYRSVRDYPY